MLRSMIEQGCYSNHVSHPAKANASNLSVILTFSLLIHRHKKARLQGYLSQLIPHNRLLSPFKRTSLLHPRDQTTRTSGSIIAVESVVLRPTNRIMIADRLHIHPCPILWMPPVTNVFKNTGPCAKGMASSGNPLAFPKAPNSSMANAQTYSTVSSSCLAQWWITRGRAHQSSSSQ